MAGNVTTPFLAVALLGLDGTLNTVLKTSRGAAQAPIDLEPLWARSLFAAVAARELAQAGAAANAGAAYTAGLLQDIGRFAMAHLEGAAYAPVCTLASSQEIAAKEMQLFGTTHAEVGAALAESWGLPADLSQAIAEHDRLTASSSPLVLLAGLAGMMADSFAANGAGKSAIRPPKGLLDKLGVSVETTQSAFDQAVAEAG
jgi:HD-like signal output (HDOD) protein